jgi:hypothetical protein
VPGRSSGSGIAVYIGVLAGIIGLVGYAVFGWRFGSSNGVLPTALGIAFVVIAIAIALRNR